MVLKVMTFLLGLKSKVGKDDAAMTVNIMNMETRCCIVNLG